jgi:hypothetical protein
MKYILFVLCMVFAGAISAQTGEVVKDSSYTVSSAGKFIQARYIEYEDGSSVTTTQPAFTADELLLKKKSEIEQLTSAMAKDVAYVSFFRRNLTEIKRQSDAMKVLTGKSPLDTIQANSVAIYTVSGWTIVESGAAARDVVFTVTAQGVMRYKIGSDAAKPVWFYGSAIRLKNHIGTGIDTDLFRLENGNFVDATRSNILRRPGSNQKQANRKK